MKMKSTGIVRKMDALGRVTVPKELRDVMGIATQDPMEYYVDGDKIIIKKYSPGCMECGAIGLQLVGEKIKVCVPCANSLGMGSKVELSSGEKF